MNAYQGGQRLNNRTYTMIQIILAVGGVFYVLIALAQLLAPEWFFQNIGNFPPFNRHYTGDLGTFTLAMGLGLLVAARDPAKHRLLVGVVAAASIFHSLNHAYDDLRADQPVAHLITDTLPLFIFGLLLVLAYYGLVARKAP